MQACFELNKKKFCVYVPIAKLPRPPIDFIETAKPDPTPWITGTSISREVTHDLSVLASINALVKTLKTPKVQKVFFQAFHEAIPGLDIPNEISITFEEQQRAL